LGAVARDLGVEAVTAGTWLRHSSIWMARRRL
jgi:hypothetical protein